MTIEANGSKWAGEAPDPIEVLMERLGAEVLDPRFEQYGNFVRREKDGTYTAWGNFLTYSHVFNIKGTREEIEPLRRAIRKNQRTPEYRAALAALSR